MSDSYSPAPQFNNQVHIDEETYLRLYRNCPCRRKVRSTKAIQQP